MRSHFNHYLALSLSVIILAGAACGGPRPGLPLSNILWTLVALSATEQSQAVLAGITITLRFANANNPVPKGRDISDTVRTTALVTVTEASIIFRVVARRCPAQSALGSPVIKITPPRYHFSCAVSAGHSIAGDIERFLTPVEAHAAFELGRGDEALETFHSYPAYLWDKPLTRSLTERGQSYQAGKWVIRATAVDDTPYGAPLASEDLYQVATHYCLLPGQICTQYLPVFRNH
jgi:hypothetical protein